MKYTVFFEHIVGSPPFPYQERLSRKFPEVLQIPSGLGKTAGTVIAWLYHHVKGHEQAPKKMVYCLPSGSFSFQIHHLCQSWLQNFSKLQTGITAQVYLLEEGYTDTQVHHSSESLVIFIGTQDLLLSKALYHNAAPLYALEPAFYRQLHHDSLWVFDEAQLMGSGTQTSAQLQAFRAQKKTNNTHSLWMSALPLQEQLKTIDYPPDKSQIKVCTLNDEDQAFPPLQERLYTEKTIFPLRDVRWKLQTSKRSSQKSTQQNIYLEQLAQSVLKKHKPLSQTLVVVNRLDRAQRLYQLLQEQNAQLPVKLIHRYYRGEELSKNISVPLQKREQIIVSTPAIETSVDLSVTTLFTELAPWPALLQRFGRCNRYGEQEEAQIFWIEMPLAKNNPECALPYTVESLRSAKQLLGSLGTNASLQNLKKIRHRQKQPFPQVIREKDLQALSQLAFSKLRPSLELHPYTGNGTHTDLLLYWQDLPKGQKPALQASIPRRESLCSVPLTSFAHFLYRLAQDGIHAWHWDLQQKAWRAIKNRRELKIGMVLLLPTWVGGYSKELGWTGVQSIYCPVPPAKEEQNAPTIEERLHFLYSQLSSTSLQDSQPQNGADSVSKLPLYGCSPKPLAHYLKALGILRIVSEQKDPNCKGFWENEHFVLQTQLNEEALSEFFLYEYQPAPLIAPWNGGSGFYPKDTQGQKALHQIMDSSTQRFSSLRAAICSAQRLMEQLHIKTKPSKEEKMVFLEACRSHFPKETLDWLDSTFFLNHEHLSFSPLLGTGGNDGRFEFTNNYMHRILDVISHDNGTPQPKARTQLRNALFATPTRSLLKDVPIGQFFPIAQGGANSNTGFQASSVVNPWDYILLLEGSTFFSSSIINRVQKSSNKALPPLTAHPVSAGYHNATQEEHRNARKEMWLPLWESPLSLQELSKSLREDTHWLSTTPPATNGLEFACSIAQKLSPSKITSYQRYGFQQRNGLAYQALSLGRYPTENTQNAEELEPFESWFKRHRNTLKKGPSQIVRACTAVEDALFALYRKKHRKTWAQLFINLGTLEKRMLCHLQWLASQGIPLFPRLGTSWLTLSDDGSREFQLALGLASSWLSVHPLHNRPEFTNNKATLSPLNNLHAFQNREELRWLLHEPLLRAVSKENTLLRMMYTILAARLEQTLTSERTFRYVSTNQISAFIQNDVDESKLEQLFWACQLLGKALLQTPPPAGKETDEESCEFEGFFPLLAYTFSSSLYMTKLEKGLDLRQDSNSHSQMHKAQLRLLQNGAGTRVAKKAILSLKARGITPIFQDVHRQGEYVRRCGAALLFPLSVKQLQHFKSSITYFGPQAQEHLHESRILQIP